MKNKKISSLQAILTCLYIASLLIANIVGTKQVQFPFGITMTTAIIVFPVTYILSDVFSEVYGYKWSRLTCYLAFALNLYMVLIFSATIAMPAPPYYENQSAFEVILGNTPRMLFASLVAYVIGDLMNDIVFKKMKAKHGEKLFKTRAILSSLCGNVVDSLIFTPAAFLGIMPLDTMLISISVYALAKTLYELIMLPLTEIVVKKVKKIEADE